MVVMIQRCFFGQPTSLLIQLSCSCKKPGGLYNAGLFVKSHLEPPAAPQLENNGNCQRFVHARTRRQLRVPPADAATTSSKQSAEVMKAIMVIFTAHHASPGYQRPPETDLISFLLLPPARL